jgi:hypothetical protein
MKKLSFVILTSATLVLAGCDNNKGGSSDQYNSSSGTASSTNFVPSTTPNSPRDGAVSPGGINSPTLDTNAQGAATSPGALDSGAKSSDPKSTNNVPQN